MRTLAFVLLAAMGMSGQQAKPKSLMCNSPKGCVCLNSGVKGKQGESCADLHIGDGPLEYHSCIGCFDGHCKWKIAGNDNPYLVRDCSDPVDIPAVQEKLPESEDNPCNVTIVKNQGKIGKLTVTDPTVNCDQPHKSRWTCTDKSRSLETSVDGKSHWCHRMEP